MKSGYNKGVKYTRKQGEVLWKDRYPLEEVLKIKNQIGIYQFSCLYQQNPVNTENQIFKKEWFTYYEEYEIINKDLEVYAMVDLALGINQTRMTTPQFK
jgi:hypothetical protein